MKLKLRNSLLLGSAILAAATTVAHAAPYTWDGTAGLWSTLTAWTPDLTVALTNADDVTFDSTGTANLTTAMGGGNQAVKSITFNSASSYTVRLYSSTSTTTTARTLTTGSITVSSGNHTFFGAKGGTGTTGSLLLTSGTYNIASGSILTLDARLRHSGTTPTYSKTGAGTLVLNADNGGSSGWVHSGFTVSQGVLRFAAANAYGNSGNTYSVTSNAALEITGGVSQGITSSGTGTITLNGTGISSTGALRSLSGNNSFTGSGGGGGIVLASDSSIGVDADTLTISQVISQSGGTRNLTKVGAGTLTLGNTNTYSGLTTVSDGTLALGASGSIANSSGVNLSASTAKFNVTTANFTLGATQTLSGIGTVENTGRTLTANGILAPGNSPGTLTLDGGTLSLGVGGDYDFQILNAAAAAGTGYDTVSLTTGTTLDLSSLTPASYTIKLQSLVSTGPDTPGNASNFNNTSNYFWTLFSTSNPITGFNNANFSIDATDFTNSLGGGSFSVALADSNTDLVLKFTAIPEPTSALAGLLLGAGLLRRRRK